MSDDTYGSYVRHFASLTDGKLIALIDQAAQVDPLALQAAKEELARRGLTTEMTDELRQGRLQEETVRERRKAQANGLVGKVGQVTNELKDTLVAPTDVQRTERRQVLVLMLATGFLLLSFLTPVQELPYMLDYGFEASMILHFLPLLAIPWAMVQLWRRRLNGWFVDAAFVVYMCAEALIGVRLGWDHQPTGNWAIDELFGMPSRSQLVRDAVITALFVALFQLRRTTTIYAATERTRWLAVITGLALSCADLYFST